MPPSDIGLNTIISFIDKTLLTIAQSILNLWMLGNPEEFSVKAPDILVLS